MMCRALSPLETFQGLDIHKHIVPPPGAVTDQRLLRTKALLAQWGLWHCTGWMEALCLPEAASEPPVQLSLN